MKKIQITFIFIMLFILLSYLTPAYSQSAIGNLGSEINSGDIDNSSNKAGPAVSNTNLSSIGPNGYDHSGNNCCGQYATSTVFNFYGLDETYPVTLKNMNPTGSFTSPDRIVDYWKKNGIAANYKNKCTLDDIKKQLDSGNPAVCLVDADGCGHWVTLIGYNTNADGTIKSFIMRDSYWGVNSSEEMPVEEFEKKWSTPLKPTHEVLGAVLNYDRLLIAPSGIADNNFSIKDILNLPNNFNSALNDQIFNGANQAVLGLGQDVTKLKSIKDFDFKKVDWPKTICGAAEVLTAVPPKLMFGLPGSALTNGGDAIKKWGAETSKKDGVINKIAGGTAKGAGIAVSAVGQTMTAAGNAVSTIIGSGFKGIRKIFGW